MRAFRPIDEDDDDSDDDWSDDEDLQSPIDDVDPFVFFVDTIKGQQIPCLNHGHLIFWVMFIIFFVGNAP